MKGRVTMIVHWLGWIGVILTVLSFGTWLLRKKGCREKKLLQQFRGKTASSMGGRDAPCGADTWRAVHPVFSPFMQKEGTYRDIGVFSCILSENDCGKAQTAGWEMAAVSPHCCGGFDSIAGAPCVV